MSYDETVLHGLWDVELDILDVIHNICVQHDLRYSLAFGSLIGLVRHGGFIPWDDDIDLFMPRKDYERFKLIWEEYASPDYIIQYKDKNSDFCQNFIKIRRNHTTFLQDEDERQKSYHKGIFVDICPCDRVAPGKIKRFIQYLACAIELLYSKEHLSGNGGIIGFTERILLLVPKRFRPKLRMQAQKVIARWNNDDSLALFCSDTIQNCRRYFPHDMFSELQLVSFQGRKYYAISKPEQFLFVRYGDYMQLPPEEERVWKHHPILIDFDHNYEELQND